MTTLDELRRANLREQRRSADERMAPKESVALSAPIVTDASTVAKPVLVPDVAEKVAANPASPTAPPGVTTTEIVVASPAVLVTGPAEALVPVTEPAAIEAAARPNGAHAANPSHAVPGAVPPAASAVATVTSQTLVDRVHVALARKVIHPTGVKATVDMPPELFWRLKRYCRDHNNVTVRQVFLDLTIAYLDEEGY